MLLPSDCAFFFFTEQLDFYALFNVEEEGKEAVF